LDVSGSRATMSLVRDERGETWTDLTWVQQSRRILFRAGPGTTEKELIRLARSLHRGRP